MARSHSLAALLASVLASGCAAAHGGDAGPALADATTAQDAPRSCPRFWDRPLVVLEPVPGSPAECQPASCEIWLGHGQHLRCPRASGPPSPVEVACDVWDCVCDDRRGFVADFASLDAIDARDGRSCRYRIVAEASE